MGGGGLPCSRALWSSLASRQDRSPCAVSVCKAGKGSFVRAPEKRQRLADATYERDEFSSKCDVPALSSPSATSIYRLLWDLAMDAFPPTATAAASFSENE